MKIGGAPAGQDRRFKGREHVRSSFDKRALLATGWRVRFEGRACARGTETLLLLGEDQLSERGEAQPVGGALVFDVRFTLPGEQCAAAPAWRASLRFRCLYGSSAGRRRLRFGGGRLEKRHGKQYKYELVAFANSMTAPGSGAVPERSRPIP